MKFLIKEISPSRKEIRVTLNSIELNGISYYIFGGVGGNFDEGTVNSKYISAEISNYYTIGPNPAIIRLIVAYLKDTLGTVYGFSDTILFTKNNEFVPIINIAVDDISLIDLSQDTIPSLVIKLLNPLPSSEAIFDEISIEKQIISTQEQEVFYISAKEPPAVIRGLAYDAGQKEEISDAALRKVEYENYNELTASFKQSDNTQINNIISSSNTNFKVDYSEFENFVHFGSAVSRVENFVLKVKQMEDNLNTISESLQTTDIPVTVNFRKKNFEQIQIIKDNFSSYEKTLYYKSDMLGYKYPINLGPNYISPTPLNTLRSEAVLNYDGFGSVYRASGSVSPKGNDIPLFRGQYKVENKPFYNHSGSFYLSYLMKGDDSINGNIQWINNQKNNIPMLPNPTLYTSSILDPLVTGSEWRRYVHQASASYWAPFASNPVIGAPGTITQFDNTDEITIFSGSGMSGSYGITCGGRYTNLATVVTSSGIQFTGSIVPAGELFRINVNTNYGTQDDNPLHITSSYLTDIKITKYDPSNALPFSEVYRTGSAEFQNWYNEQHASASIFDEQNVHSLLKTLPAYLAEDSQMDNSHMRKFVHMMGEQFDETKNYIDSYITIFRTQYGQVGTVPDNLLPILANSNNWQFALPFGKKTDADLSNFLGTTMSQLNNTANTKNNIWRNIVNNLLYIYKRKGTQEGIRGLLNSYGFPPDILKVKEHGASMDQAENAALSDNTAPSLSGLSGESGNTSFTTKVENMVMWVLNGDPARIINADWRRNNVSADVIEFIIKPSIGNSHLSQSIIESSGSGAKDLWDIILEPSQSSNIKGRLSFRINNAPDGDASMDTNIISMSTDYYNIKNQNYWNVLVQRTEGSSGSSADLSITDLETSHSYEMYIAEQKSDQIRVLQKVSMSYGGSNHTNAAANWIGTGSRHIDDSGNLVIGRNYTGSIAEIRTWKYPLSASIFKQHVYDKKSSVGNSLTDSQTNLIYRFKLNENYLSGSVNPKIKDANPQNVQDYSIPFSGPLTASLTSSLLYDLDTFERIQFSVGIGGAYEMSDNSIIIDAPRRYIDNLNPFTPSIMNMYHPLINKRKASSVLELTKSPQEVINDFILNQLGNFDFNDLFADPRDILKETYTELDSFAENFFLYYDIWMDINKYIRTQAAIFNDDLIKSIKRLVPARAAFSKIGVEIKPTFFERQKLPPPSLEKQILSFETTIPFTDWEKDQYSLTTIDNLQPIFEPNTHMEIYAHTGSQYYDFSNQYELYKTKDAFLELASATGSKKYYDFTDQYELYQTKDTSFDIVGSGVTPYPSIKLTENWTEYPYQDVGFNIASSTGSLSPTYIYEHYKYHKYHFDVASSTGSITNEFTKYEPLYLNKDVHFSVAAATGSISKDFSKYESLYKYNNIHFDVASSTGSISKTFIRYEPLYLTKNIDFSVASATGSISKEFSKYESLYKYHDIHFSLASATGSISKDFAKLEPASDNKDLYIFNVRDYYDSSSKSGNLRFTNEVHTPTNLHIFDVHDYYISSSKTDILGLTNKLHNSKDLHLFDVFQFFRSSSKYLKFATEIYKPLDNTIELASPTGSSQGYYNLTDQYELYQTKDKQFDVASSSGSITTFNYELYQMKNLHLFDANNHINANRDEWNMKITNQPIDPDDLYIFDVHDYYDSSSKSNSLRFTNELHNSKDLHILNTDNFYTSGSDTNKLRFRQEMYENWNLNLIDMDNMYHSSSKYLQFNTENYNYDNLELLNITSDFNSNTDSEILSFTTIEHQYENLGFDVASSTGSIVWNFSNAEPLYQDKAGNIDINEKGSGGSESSSYDFFIKEYEYKPLNISVASNTTSNPEVGTDIFLPHVGAFNFIGNTTFYDHAQKPFSDLSQKWGRSEDDVKFIHFGYAGKDGDFNTFHYENRYVFHSLGDVESISGSNASISSSFETDYDGIYVDSTNYTASKHFSNEKFLKLNDFLGNRPVGTTIQFKPSSQINFGGGKFLDEVFVYPPNHIFLVGTSKDTINRLIYKGTQNYGGTVLESEAFTDLDEGAFYHVLTTGGNGPTVQQ